MYIIHIKKDILKMENYFFEAKQARNFMASTWVSLKLTSSRASFSSASIFLIALPASVRASFKAMSEFDLDFPGLTNNYYKS